ncbi:MAG: leucine-rich repeat domain-containing protein [Bacteroidales bacterium]|nr:leucine-rich repeat domain-containing protein [Bacteroidales bacterium]
MNCFNWADSFYRRLLISKVRSIVSKKSFMFAFICLLFCLGNRVSAQITIDGVNYYVISGTNKVKVASNCLKSWPAGTEHPTSLTIPSQIEYNSITYTVVRIDNDAFNGDNKELLTEVILPNTIKEIGSSAFKNSVITSISIPSSVTMIDKNAFRSCKSLTTVEIAEGLTSLSDGCFSQCEKLTSVTLPASLTSIGNEAFSECFKLPSVTIPSSVTSIGSKAFWNCKALETVTIPSSSSLTSIGDYAFQSCIVLKDISLPASLSSMGGGIFSNCESLKTLPLAQTQITSVPKEAFSRCTALTTVTFPTTLTSIGEDAFIECASLECAITIPDYVVSIGRQAFRKCSKIPSVTISATSSLQTIGELAFENCNLIESLLLPSSLSSLGKGAFANCFALATVDIQSENLEIIPARAFYHCSALTEFTIPNSVVSIGDSVFDWCNVLNTVTIPENVTSIGTMAFPKIVTLVSKAFNPPAASDNAFNPSLIKIDVPCGSSSLYKAASEWSKYSDRIYPESLESEITRAEYLEDCDCTFPETITIKDGGSLSAKDYSALKAKLTSKTIKVEKVLPVNRWSMIGNLTATNNYSVLNGNRGESTNEKHELVALPFDYETNEWATSYAYASDETPQYFGAFMIWPLSDAMETDEELTADNNIILTQTLDGASLNENADIVFSGIENKGSSPNWFALSNPYIGLLDLKAFRTSNTNIDQVNGHYAYVWNPTKGSSEEGGDWEYVSMEDADRPVVSPFGAFFVAATSTEPKFTFKSTYIVTDETPTVTYKSAQENSKIEFTCLAAGNEQKIFAQHSSIASDGFDKEDSYIMFSSQEDAVNPYFLVEDKNLLENRFNSLPYVCDLNFNSYRDNTAEFSLTKAPSDIEVIFVDKENGNSQTVMGNGETLLLNLSQGANSGKYQLMFSKKNVALAELQTEENNISIFNTGKELNISGKGLKRLEVYNTLGQKVYSESLTSDNAKLNMALSNGVYVVKVYAKGMAKSQKIVVK